MTVLLALAGAGVLIGTGWWIGHLVGSTVHRNYGERWMDLHDVFTEEDQDVVG